MCGVFYPKSGVFLGSFWVVFWVGVFGLWGGVLGPWCSGHTGYTSELFTSEIRTLKYLVFNIFYVSNIFEQLNFWSCVLSKFMRANVQCGQNIMGPKHHLKAQKHQPKTPKPQNPKTPCTRYFCCKDWMFNNHKIERGLRYCDCGGNDAFVRDDISKADQYLAREYNCVYRS